MLIYRILSLIIGFGAFFLLSSLAAGSGVTSPVTLVWVAGFPGMLIMLASFVCFEMYCRKKGKTDSEKQFIHSVVMNSVKYRAASIVIGFLFFMWWSQWVSRPGEGMVFTVVLKVVPAVIVYLLVAKVINAIPARAEKVQSEAKRETDQQTIRQQQQREHQKTQLTALNEGIATVNAQEKDAETVLAFYKSLKWIAEQVRMQPLKAATYRYAVEYLDYAYADQNFTEQLQKRSVNEETATLLNEYRAFLQQQLPLARGYNERKAAWEESLKSAPAAVVGVNDI